MIFPLYSTISCNEDTTSNSLQQLYCIEETFPNGHSVQVTYNSDKQPLRIQIADIADIICEYVDGKISKIHRLNNKGQVLYTHTYLSNDGGGGKKNKSRNHKSIWNGTEFRWTEHKKKIRCGSSSRI